MILDLRFRGLAAPLRLDAAEPILPVLAEVMPGWPTEVAPADPRDTPFFSITGTVDGVSFRCQCHVEDRPAQVLDAVNAVCDAIAALAMAVPAEDDRVICLHAAGVVLGGRIVVFPNVRRAGKSTLSAALAQAGCRVYSDDVLPIRFPGRRVALVEALGVAPRLRLPLPATLPQAFRDWAAARPGPENRQYKYLALPDAPARSESLPVGAFVILDRQDGPVPARLDPVPPDAAMDALLHQHFTRDRHSGDVLDAMAAVLGDLPVWRLTYAGLEEAVACLRAAFADLPAAPDLAAPAVRFRMAEFAPIPQVVVGAVPLVQRPGAVARAIGEGLYLADPEGRAIHRMDPLAAAIWEVLETPATAGEIVALLAEAFPGADPARLGQDVSALLAGMAAAGLIGEVA